MRKITESNEPEAGFRLNIGDYARVLWRKKYFLVVPLLISVAVTAVGSRFLVPEYESSAIVRISSTRDMGEMERFIGMSRSRDDEVGAQLEADLLGSAFLDELIRSVGMDRDPDLIELAEYQRQNLYPGVTTEDLVMRRLRNFLQRHISLHREGPSMWRISYADANPEAAYVIADAMTRLYIERKRRLAMRDIQEVSQFSEEQLAVYKERLDRSVRDLERFQEQMASRGTEANPVTQSNISLAEKIRTDLDFTIRNAETTQQRIRERLVAVLGGVPSGERIFSDPEIRKLESNLAARREAELLADLSVTPTPTPLSESDDIVESQQAIQHHLGTLVAEKLSDVPYDYRPLVVEYFYQQIQVNAYRQKLSRLETYNRAFRAQVQLAPQQDTELSRLRQEVEHNREVYNTFRATQTSTQISEAAQSTDIGATVALVEAASRPLEPVRPNKIKILALAFVLGAGIGASGLLLTEFSDTSFRSVDDVEKLLGLKVLGTVPRFEKTRWFHDSARKRAIIWTITCVVATSAALTAFYLFGKSTREQLIELDIDNAAAAPREP
ncbi:MAG TPA: GNVR domain-containing protein [Candidatus Krumholzibacteria bacterium]|nr:GNVR domain-containing protein [Candidatus Krumholzibacteria bacterium]